MWFTFRTLAADDIFISYSRRDGNTYAAGLADELTQRGFSCFFDKLGTDADPNLPSSLRRKIRRCAMLVVIGSAGAGTSIFVVQEVEEFTRAQGTARAVPVLFGEPNATGLWQHSLVGIAPEIEDPRALETGNPSRAIVNRIEKSFQYARSKERLRRYTFGAATMLTLLVLASLVAGVVARNQLAQARKATADANAAKAEAARQQKRAQDERANADREALIARAAGLVAIARDMTDGDPLTASLLLVEAIGPVEPSGGVAAARELMSRYVTKVTLRGHQKSQDKVVGIYDVALSPDGSRVVTGGSDGTARVWTNEINTRSVVLNGQEGDIITVQFSPDGERVLTASRFSVRLWHADGTGVPVVLPGPKSDIAGAHFSPDGQHVLRYGSETTIQRADGTGSVIALKHPGYVHCAVFSPDGTRVLTGSLDGNARVWRADGAGTCRLCSPEAATRWTPAHLVPTAGSPRSGR